MTSKERVLKAAHREQPDRVPFNYYGNKDIDRRLAEHFGTEDFRTPMKIDFRGVHAPYIGPKLYEDKGDVKVDNFGIHRAWTEHQYGGYWEVCEWPLKDATAEEIAALPLPNPDDYDYSAIPAMCDAVQEYCVYTGGAGWPDIINSCGMLRTMEQILVDLITDDEAGLLLIQRRNEINLEIARRSLEAADGRIDMLCLGEDLGTQRGPTLGLDLFRQHIRPAIQSFVDIAKAYGAVTMFHSCGSSSWAYEDFIEIGLDVVETLQPEAKDMAPTYLKKTFGDRIAFHGCISTAGPLAYGSVDDVKQNVKETLEIMMPGGGYMLSPTHCIQDNTPTENVLALYEAGEAFGRYT